MKKVAGIALGIMTALGGFVDFGQIIFTMQAGARFEYRLIWPILLGTAAIIVYLEMCGRVAVVAHEPVFSVVRHTLGRKLGIATLVASNLLNVITCAAELGGIAVVLRILTGWNEKLVLVLAGVVLYGLIRGLPFQGIENVFGLAGLAMAVVAVAAIKMHPDWRAVAMGMLPKTGAPPRALYWYFAVGIFSAMLMEYEVHFYSSGAIEEKWKPKDLAEDFFVASFGSIFGALLTVALLIVGASVFAPRGIFPKDLQTAMQGIATPLGAVGMTFVFAGTIACLAGASVETALSGAYNACQFFGLPWGKNLSGRDAQIFTKLWTGMWIVALAAAAGFRPEKLVNISVIFGMAVMPFTYYPILRIAMNRRRMGRHVNSRMDTAVGVALLVLIVAAAVAAIPLMIVTNSGEI